MKRISPSVVALLAIVPMGLSSLGVVVPNGYQWTQVWGDDFNSGSTPVAPDSTKWGYEIGYLRNQEAQYYTNSIKNVYCKDGVLNLVGLKNDTFNGTTYPYTSGSINTKNKYSYKYGKMEVRAKVPTQAGCWPAIWSMGTSGGWPGGGETDIMEFWANQGTNFYTTNFHFKTKTNGHGEVMQWVYPPANNYPGNGQFHVYGLEWDKDTMRFTYDGEYVSSADRWAIENNFATGTTPYDNPNYLLLNLALGGTGGGTIASNFVSQYYQIDYVHISQLTPVPEPASLGLLLAAVPMVAMRSKRRRLAQK